MQVGWDPELGRQAWGLLQVVAVAATAGWTAERLLDTGVETRGLPLLAGLFGLYIGPHMLDGLGWPSGPTIAGHPLVAAFAGALAVCTFLKFASLATAGSRR
jgi:uncharacterized membrane protein YeaQ/YmgE (transglycosylase-associated protein family)